MITLCELKPDHMELCVRVYLCIYVHVLCMCTICVYVCVAPVQCIIMSVGVRLEIFNSYIMLS